MNSMHPYNLSTDSNASLYECCFISQAFQFNKHTLTKHFTAATNYLISFSHHMYLSLFFQTLFCSMNFIVFYQSAKSIHILSVRFCFHPYIFIYFVFISDMKGSTTFVYSINSFGSTQIPSAPKGIIFFCVFILH